MERSSKKNAPVRHKILLLGLALGWGALFCLTAGWLVAPLSDVVRALAPGVPVLGAVLFGLGALVCRR